MKDILEKEYNHYEYLIKDLQQNFYPDCTIIKGIEWIKGIHKYEWLGNFVFEYFNSIYLVEISAVGNGGWLSIDDCKVLSINRVKKATKTVLIEVYEKA